MLLQECLQYSDDKNVDRIWASAYAIDCALGNTIRQNIQKISTENKKEYTSPNFRFNPQKSIARSMSKSLFSPYHKIFKR
jgi:hypothetical protein